MKQLGFLAQLDHPTEAIRQFTPSWFTVTMGTGIISQLLYNFPYPFQGLEQLAWAFWWLNILLFTLFSIMQLAQIVCFPREALLMLHDPTQSLFIGSIPMGFATIVNGIVFFCVPRYGSAAVDVAWVTFWIDTGLSLISGWLVPYYMFVHHRHKMETMTSVWFFPVVPGVVAALSAAIVGKVVDPRSAAQLVFTGYVLWGMTIPLAFFVITIFFLRLMLHSMPSKESMVSCLLPMGPFGASSGALISLGALAMEVFSEQTNSDPILVNFARSAAGFGLVAGLILWGFGVWWLLMTASLLGTHWGRLPFNMGWWAFIFPMGIYCAATDTLAKLTGLQFFQVMGAMLTVAIFVGWLYIMSMTAIKAWQGHLFRAYSPSQPMADLRSAHPAHSPATNGVNGV
ncbi:hypothetical protein WJX75_005365 [Coccomyxa subellipsoidea]|uniref:C4-dicarboxylate transporter/malic acid transport protein n=1 Tax=Coccomyxa subellipsoidea TaxID=248742 RepID=A0ABR2YE57_9CHLO